MLSQLYFKNELSYKFIFCMWLEIHKRYKFDHLFQVSIMSSFDDDDDDDDDELFLWHGWPTKSV